MCYNEPMKHHCHCGLKEHFQSLRVKKLGVLGVVLMILHILFHVVECLLIPTLLVAIHDQETQPATAASSSEQPVVDLQIEYSPLTETNFFESWRHCIILSNNSE